MTLVKPHESLCIEANRDITVNKGVFNCIGVGTKSAFVIRGKIKTFKVARGHLLERRHPFLNRILGK